MKVNIFMPKYMEDFKCIGPACNDTCCAGWDINIDEVTYNKYENSIGNLKELVKGKYICNKDKEDSFNYGFMVIKEENKCPFLNSNMLCDIHGGCGEENLSITCKRYPRVFNIVDDIYEKSGLPSCEEVCIKAFLNKDKMEFVEKEEDLEEEALEIRRIVDSEAFEGTESLLQYFWDIRVISINIMQHRELKIEERLNLLREFYSKIQNLKSKDDFYNIELLLEEYNEGKVDYISKEIKLKESYSFYDIIGNDEIFASIRGVRLKECLKEYRKALNNLDKYDRYLDNLEEYSYILENYIVNQIFKDMIPFNKGENLLESVNVLINTYKIIKSYIIGIAINSKDIITEKVIIRVIQALSKDIEHNKVFNGILNTDFTEIK